MTNQSPHINIANYLRRMVALQPYKRAVVCPEGCDRNNRIAYAHLTFKDLDRESDDIARGLQSVGIHKGTRTILMVKPSLEFFALIFALFKTGAIPVVVDPGMGIRRMMNCYRESQPTAFIGIPLAHMLRRLYPKFFKSIQIWITVGRRWFWGGFTLNQIRQPAPGSLPIAETRSDDMAAILFTTGSTGPAKGAVYTHGNFDAQLKHIKKHLGIDSDEIDLSTFPLFALFYPALGITTIIPDMNPIKPAQANPQQIFKPIVDQGVTNMFASPALLNRLGAAGKKKGIKLTSLRRVISAGAPVAPFIIDQFSALLSNDAEVHTPYGATEAVPIISITSQEILTETRKLTEQGMGICVGRPINDIEIRIIKISDEPINQWSDSLEIAPGEVGEIAVKADLVSPRYIGRPDMNAISKIQDEDGFWHRMGDLGRLDHQGRIWFYGRKSHRVITSQETLFTIPCEAIFNNHPAVFRSALVGIGTFGSQVPVICIELSADGKFGHTKKNLTKELLALGKQHHLTQSIRTVLFCKSFPVDIRHNAKIFREKLAVWATKRLGNNVDAG